MALTGTEEPSVQRQIAGAVALTLRQLRREILRPTLTVIAVAGVIAEILLLEGFLAGMYAQLRQAVLKRGGDLIVTQAGISNFTATRSILPQTARLDVEELEGVRIAHPLTGIAVIYERDGRRTPIMVVVYDSAGGPTHLVSGEAGRPGGDAAGHPERGIVIDRSLALKYGLAAGDPMMISDFEFTVSGVSTNSSAFFTPFAFISFDDLIDFYFSSDVAADIATFPLLSFLLVEIEPDHDPAAVAARIEQSVESADVFPPAMLATRDENLGREMMGPILGLLLLASYLIGVLVVGMFLFLSVRGRLRELAVLKALGFRTVSLSLGAVFEATFLTLMALPLGILLAGVVAQVIHANAPLYLILATDPTGIARTASAAIVFAIVGALVPVRTIASVDPAVVFRS